MTQGFYEQLGVDPNATQAQIREAWIRAVGWIMERRAALEAQGGDTASLDVAREAADRAWQVLSDPATRRRYDAMRAFSSWPHRADEDALWAEVVGAVVDPAASAAAELVRVSTSIHVGTLPPPPTSATMEDDIPYEEDLTVQASIAGAFEDVPTAAPTRVERTSSGVPQAAVAFPGVQVVAPPAPPVVQATASRQHIASEDIARLERQLGVGGAYLRAIREMRGLSIQDMADATRISARYLDALEREDFDALPSTTFVQGYVREVVRVLDLDLQTVVPAYLARRGA